MSIDVTVVVPVYNPGRYIEACIEGYLSQTMPRDRREIIFVDDGSTDETPERLDRLAAEHPDVHVVHQANSGWPGQPRNVGIEAAHGEYLFFCDHDDRLSPKALQKMVAMARRTGADVLIPKMVGHGRRVPRTVFRTNIDRVVLAEDPVMAALTPHKLVRRAFLNEHGLRFPEGRRRLEDHVFVVEAFLLADVISVLSDYPCYHRYRRHDDSNAAFQEWTADYYFRFVAEVIDVIDAHTEPGELRNQLLQRPYAGEMLNKLREQRLQYWDDESRQQIFDEVRALAIERFPPAFHEGLGISLRAHAQALVNDRMDQLTEVAARAGSVKAQAVLRDLRWAESGWVADIEAEMVHADGSPIRLVPTGAGWSPDPRLIPPELDAGPYDLEQIEAGGVDVLLRHQVTDVEWYADAELAPELVQIAGDPDGAYRLVFRGTATVSPATVAGGKPLSPGEWDIVLRFDVFGISRIARPKRMDRHGVWAPRALLLPVKRVVTPRLARKHALVFKVVKLGKRRKRTAAALRQAREPIVTSAGDLVTTIDLALEPAASPVECCVILVGGANAAPRRLGRLSKKAVGPMLADKLLGRAGSS